LAVYSKKNAPLGAPKEPTTMSTRLVNRPKSALIASAALGLVLAVAAVSPADAGNRSQKQRAQGDHTRHTEVRRTDNGHARTDTWSGERGTATRQAEVVNDTANRKRTREVAWTGPNGQQGTRVEATQRTDNGYTRNSTATGPNGGTATRDVTAVRDPASGTWTKDVSVRRTPPPNADGG
jgi:hypothetical protein